MSDTSRPGLKDRLFVGMQHVLPQHALSRVIHGVARIRQPAIKNAIIRAFVRGFRPRMEEAAQPDPLAYASFNDFFTRTLRPDARPVEPDPGTLISPVDGTVSQIGYLDELRLIQAKGRYYALDALLGGAQHWTQRLAGGSFATLYLAPYNYHRIHMPIAGTLRAAWYVPGRLFSVNAVTAASVAGLFARNERVVCIFENGPVTFAMVLVGALFVGSISTVWHGDVTPRSPRRMLELSTNNTPVSPHLEKAQEMGRFNMGSTVILVFPKNTLQWLPEFAAGTRIQVGQPLARLSREE